MCIQEVGKLSKLSNADLVDNYRHTASEMIIHLFAFGLVSADTEAASVDQTHRYGL